MGRMKDLAIELANAQRVRVPKNQPCHRTYWRERGQSKRDPLKHADMHPADVKPFLDGIVSLIADHYFVVVIR